MANSRVPTVAVVAGNTAYPLIANISIDQHGQPVFHPCLTTTLMLALEVAMNQKFAVKIATDWGEYNESTAVSTGMVSYVANGEADIGVTLMADLPARRHVIDYSLSVFKGAFSAFHLLPNVRASAFGLLQPFGGLIALVIVVCLAAAACGSALNGIVFKDRVVGEMQLLSIPIGRRISYNESWCLTQAIGLLCSRSISLTPNSRFSSENTTAFTLALTGFLLVSIYTSFNLAYLTSRYHSFQSPEQLLAASYTFGFSPSYPIVQYFMYNHDERSDIKAAFVRGKKEFQSLQEAKSTVLLGSYAFVNENWVAYTALRTEFSESEQCSVGEVPIAQISQSYAAVMAKNSAYKPVVDYHMIEFKQYGLNKLWIHRYIPNRIECKQGAYESVHAEGLLAAFYGLLISGAVSLMALGGELVVWYANTHRSSNNILP